MSHALTILQILALPRRELGSIENCGPWPFFRICNGFHSTPTRPTYNHKRTCSKSHTYLVDNMNLALLLLIDLWLNNFCRVFESSNALFPACGWLPRTLESNFGFTRSGFRRVCRICIEVRSSGCSRTWLLIALEKGCGSIRVTCSPFCSCCFIAIIALIGCDFALICWLSVTCSRSLFGMLEKGFTEDAINKWPCNCAMCHQAEQL